MYVIIEHNSADVWGLYPNYKAADEAKKAALTKYPKKDFRIYKEVIS